MNKSYFTCPRCGTNHDCDPHGSRWFEPIESSGEEEKTTLYPGRRWDELSREQQAQFLKDCEEGARNARLGPCDRPDAGIGQYAGFSAPDIKPGVNIGPLSGPDAISAKEAEEGRNNMDAKLLTEILEFHGKWLKSIDGGKRANLSWANLSRANLSGAKLFGANLSGADLSGANLSRADLSWADLSGADLSGANLSWANLSRANLSGANLSRANLSGAKLFWANLYGANLSWANLYGANLFWANLSGANLYGANLSGADGKKITLVGERPFLQIGPIGSRADCLLVFITSDGICLRAGCWFGTLKEFTARVKKTHEDTAHGREYAAAIELVRAHAELWTPKRGE